jgi:organic hydroperoxide reductase OsmC/OhrA
MHQHEATISWNRGDQKFTDNRYSREHSWSFDGGVQIPASSSPFVVPEPMSVAANVDPEEAFVAAVSSCHMLTFLWVASGRGFVVDSYVDRAVGIMEQNTQGKFWVSRVSLRPQIVFSGERQPTTAELNEMHHKAHEDCFIANSVKSDIVVEEV